MTAGDLNGNDYHVSYDSTKRLKPSAAALHELCARFEEQCRARGLRRTPQRLAVYRALARDPGHPTADALYRHLRRALPSLSLATVYRTLESLARAGLVRRVGGGEGGGRFDANPLPHQHLVCRACGRVADVAYAPLAGLAPPRGELEGFLPERLDVRIVGLCAQCRAGARRTARPQRKRTSSRRERSPAPL